MLVLDLIITSSVNIILTTINEFMEHSLLEKLRHYIKKIPGNQTIYSRIVLLFKSNYSEDGLKTYHNASFLKNPDFIHAYSEALKQDNHAIKWRAHITQWAGDHASKLEGDFVECGVNTAFLTKSVVEYTNFSTLLDKTFYLFDTYNGLVESLVTEDDIAAHRNEYTECYQFVIDTFKDYKNVKVIKGIVPDSLNSENIEKVAYLSIDMNCVLPEIAALEFFWPKMVKGGIIILDDYDSPGHEAQQEGADKFAHSVEAKILCLPTGQGILIK